MISIQTLWGFIRKELRQSLRDPKMRQLLFVSPVIILIVFGFALSSETKNIRLAIHSEPNDVVLRQVYDHAIGTKWFTPTVADPNREPSELIYSSDAEAILVAPPGGLTRAIERGDGELQLLINGSDVLRAQAIDQYVTIVVRDTVEKELRIEPPPSLLHFDVRILYNPTLSTAAYMLPGTLMLVLLQLTVVVTSMAISREKETGTYEAMISTPVSPKEIIFGKTIPYVFLGMMNFPILLSAVHFIFHVPIRGSLLILILSTLIFVCTTAAVGALIGTLTRTQQQSFMASFLFVFPGILLSGMLFPLENMPMVMKAVAYCNPLTHFLELIRNILLKGGSPSVIVMHLSVLVGMGVLFGIISFKKFHTTLN
jgi:ABC-2 type transport system permease protein